MREGTGTQREVDVELRQTIPLWPVPQLPAGPATLGKPVVTVAHREDGLQLLRIHFAPGQELPKHKVPGPVMLVAAEGKLNVRTAEGDATLAAGHALSLATNEEHAVRAEVESVLLVFRWESALRP